MEWNVFYHEINGQKIKILNIFDHGGFANDVQKDLKKYKNKADFADRLRNNLLYYFWCKAEYEVLIRGWCGGNGDEEIKVDIYTQVMNNWPIFLDYVWNSVKRKTKKVAADV